jgi:hypothetical protein
MCFKAVKHNTIFLQFQEYLSNNLQAILEDDVNVTAYTAWSLMDNLHGFIKLIF